MSAPDVRLRPFPYPYRAMLAVCSDLDETPDRHVYREIMRFLNTTESTAMGPGVGLEVGNTIYFDMPPDEFAYWNTDDAGRDMVRTLIRSGHIDCLHSYGDFADTRGHAGKALDELARHDCRIEVWIDHRVAPSNFGADIMHGRGDVPGDDVYHADLTCGFGVKYVWRGRVTSVIGQDVPRRLAGVFDARHPLASTKTLGKEIAKGILARRGNAKYAMHAANESLRPETLRDGRPVLEFFRANPFWGGVENADTAAGVAETIRPRMLDHLVRRGGVCIFYTHLGKVASREKPFNERTVRSFRDLAAYHQSGKILVATTQRLLRYRHFLRDLSWTIDHRPDKLQIEIAANANPNGRVTVDLQKAIAGLTFYVPDGSDASICVAGVPMADILRNPPDETGRCSISVPWRRLEFPKL